MKYEFASLAHMAQYFAEHADNLREQALCTKVERAKAKLRAEATGFDRAADVIAQSMIKPAFQISPDGPKLSEDERRHARFYRQ